MEDPKFVNINVSMFHRVFLMSLTSRGSLLRILFDESLQSIIIDSIWFRGIDSLIETPFMLSMPCTSWLSLTLRVTSSSHVWYQRSVTSIVNDFYVCLFHWLHLLPKSVYCNKYSCLWCLGSNFNRKPLPISWDCRDITLWMRDASLRWLRNEDYLWLSLTSTWFHLNCIDFLWVSSFRRQQILVLFSRVIFRPPFQGRVD